MKSFSILLGPLGQEIRLSLITYLVCTLMALTRESFTIMTLYHTCHQLKWVLIMRVMKFSTTNQIKLMPILCAKISQASQKTPTVQTSFTYMIEAPI
jgi:hypothetical protein